MSSFLLDPTDNESFDDFYKFNEEFFTTDDFDLIFSLSGDNDDDLMNAFKEIEDCCLDEDEIVPAPDKSPDEHLVAAPDKSPDEDLVPQAPKRKFRETSRSNKKRRRTSQCESNDFKGKCCLDPSHTTFRKEWRRGPLGKSTLCTTCSCAQQRKTLKWTVCPTTGKVMNSDRSSKKLKLMVESPSVIQEAYRQGLFDKSYLMTTHDSVSAVAV